MESRLEGELVPCPLAGECVHQELSGHKGSIHKTFGWCLRDQAQSPRGLSDKTCDTGARVGYKSPSPVLWPELLRVLLRSSGCPQC